MDDRRRRILWSVAGVAAGLATIAGGLWLVEERVADELCSYEMQGQAAVSPDGRQKAAVVAVDCGATTDFATWAVVTDAGSTFHFSRDRVASVTGKVLQIRWEGPRLILLAPPDAKRFDGPAASRTKLEFRPL
jgi:hypothetical protein